MVVGSSMYKLFSSKHAIIVKVSNFKHIIPSELPCYDITKSKVLGLAYALCGNEVLKIMLNQNNKENILPQQ